MVDVGDQPAGADLRERRRLDLEVLEEARDLGRVGQGHEGHVLQAGEDQEVQAHADREREVLHQREQLLGGVVALQHRRPRRAQHPRHDRMRVLDVDHLGLHRHEHDVGVVAVDHEVGDVGQELVIGLLADVGGRGAGLAHRDPDQLAPAVEALALERVLGERRGLEQQRRVGGDHDLAGEADLLEDLAGVALAHRDHGGAARARPGPGAAPPGRAAGRR